MEEKNSILIIGNYEFPTGNASALLMLTYAKLYKELGYQINMIGCSRSCDGKHILDTKKIYEGFTGYNFNYARNAKEWLNYKKYYKEFLDVYKKINSKVKYIILYASPCVSLFNNLIIKFCKKNNIKVIVIIVDWMGYTGNNLVLKCVKKIDNWYRIKKLNKKADLIIAISEFLYNYYKEKNKNVILIPPINDIQIDYNETKSKCIKLIYMGQPFSDKKYKISREKFKDRLDLIIEALSKNGADFVFDIYGLTKEDYLFQVPEHENLITNKINFKGRVEHNLIMKNINKYDFSIFVRENTLSNQAGFPSKLSESISCGVPVITTNTSDITKYIKNGKNGFIIQNMENLNEELDKILKMEKKKIEEIRRYTYKNNYFNYRNYIDIIKNRE